MSRLWRDRVAIALGRDHVALQRQAAFSRRVRARERITLDCGANGELGLAVLERLLSANEWRRADASVVLSDHFVRYVCLAWNGDLSGDEEWEQFARMRLTDVFGTRAESWTLSLDRPLAGMPGLAAAIDLALFDRVKTLLRGADLALDSLRPNWITAFNRHRSALRGKRYWLAVTESARLTVAFIDKGAVIGLRSQHIQAPLVQELPRTLEQCALTLDQEERKVYLVAPEVPDFSLPADWHLQRLPAEQVESDQLPYVMVMNA